MVYRIFFILSIYLFCACNESSIQPPRYLPKDSTVRIDTQYYDNGKIKTIARYHKNRLNGVFENFYTSGKLETRKTYINDTAKGVALEYYETGLLKKMSYLINDFQNIYYWSFDSVGKLEKEEGTPLLKNDVWESKNHDTFYVKGYVCCFGLRNIQYEVSPNNLNFKKFDLEPTGEEFIKVVTFSKPIKSLNEFSFYIKLSCLDKWNNSKVYYDTLSFQKNKNTN